MRKYHYILLSNDSGERLELQDAPKGWEDMKVSVIRDMIYFGIFKTLSVEFDFVGDGFKFMQSHRLRFGTDTDILFRLYQGNTFIFEGKVNLENFEEDRDINTFKVDLVQSTFVQSFQNFENVKFNVLNNLSTNRKEIAPAQVQTAVFRDRVLRRFSEFNGVIGGTGQDPQIYHHTLPFDLITNDNPSVKAINAIELSPDLDEFYHPDNALFVNNTQVPQTIVVDWSINYTTSYEGPSLPFRPEGVPEGAPPQLRALKNVYKFQVMNENGSIDQVLFTRTLNKASSPSFSWGTFEDSFAGEITLTPGQYLMFTCERIAHWWVGGSVFEDSLMGIGPMEENWPMDIFKVNTVYNSMTMTILQDSVFPDTEAPVILPHELFTNLIAQMTGVDNALYSELFGRTDLGYAQDGEFAYLGITKGDLLRGVPLDETQVATSMRDAFKSYNILNLAVLIRGNNQIQIERKDQMFNRNLIADLGEVSKLKISSTKEFNFNSVVVGYPKAEYEEDNGRDEFNTEVQYTNSFRGVKQELDLRSVYRADGRGIEEARRLQVATTGTKDSRYDDKIFLIDLIKEDGVLKTRRLEGINFVGGVINPNTVMNARISPGQIMLMWQKYLAIPLHRKDKVYYFQTKDKNSGFQVITDLGQSFDGEDLQITDAAYFLNEQHQFEFPIKFSTLFSILANPFGVIKYSYKKETFYDHLFEIDAEVETKGGQWRTLGTKPTPVQVSAPEEAPNALKYDEGANDYVKYGDNVNDIILYE